MCCSAAAQDAPAASGMLDLLLPLLLVIATGAAAWWLVRRRGSLLRGDGPLQIVQVVPVGPRERVLLLRIGDRHLLCGATPAQITLLCELQGYTPDTAAGENQKVVLREQDGANLSRSREEFPA